MIQWAPNGGNHKNFCGRETFFSTRRRLYVRSFLPPNGRRRAWSHRSKWSQDVAGMLLETFECLDSVVSQSQSLFLLSTLLSTAGWISCHFPPRVLIRPWCWFSISQHTHICLHSHMSEFYKREIHIYFIKMTVYVEDSRLMITFAFTNIGQQRAPSKTLRVTTSG